MTTPVDISNPSSTPSRSLSVSYDNPSIEELSIHEENQVPEAIPIDIESPIPIITSSEISSSLSELDPMLKTRSETSSPIAHEQTTTETSDEQIPIEIVNEKDSFTETIENPSPITEDTSLIIEREPSISVEDSVNEPSISIDESVDTSEKNEPSLSTSFTESSNGDLFQLIQDDVLDIP